MDVIKQLGELAIGSRLKRLSDRIMREGSNIYRKHGIDLEPRWFPVYYLLSQRSGIGVMEIAAELDTTHPSVSQIVKEMQKRGLIDSTVDKNDARKKLLSLSKKGTEMLPKIRPIWNDIAAGAHNILSQCNNNLLAAVEEVENHLNRQPFDKWVDEVTTNRHLRDVDIVDYKPRYKDFFRDLNYEWIGKYFKIEDYDREVLENPDSKIIRKGGYICFALMDGEIIGTCALMKMGDGIYELSKMAVTEKAQGKQAGKKLAYACLDKAKDLGAEIVFLESNKSLTPAITMYRKLGFIEMPKGNEKSIYQRANIYMELQMKDYERKL